jgi:hypothetical protein
MVVQRGAELLNSTIFKTHVGWQWVPCLAHRPPTMPTQIASFGIRDGYIFALKQIFIDNRFSSVTDHYRSLKTHLEWKVKYFSLIALQRIFMSN